MKKKALVKFLIVAAAATSVMAFSGCSSSGSSFTLDSYWYESGYQYFQNNAVGSEEKLTYNITIDEDTIENSTYHLSLAESTDYSYTTKNGISVTTKTNTYTTYFGIGIYEWSDNGNTFTKIDDNNKASYQTNGAYVAGENQEFVYYYETTQVVRGAFVFGGVNDVATAENSVYVNNVITTVAYFRSANDNLAPVYSYYEADVISPNSASDLGSRQHFSYEIQYNKDSSSAACVYTEYDVDTGAVTSTSETTYGTGGTVFDNSQLYIAIRGMSLSSSYSADISVLVPADKGTQTISVEGSETNELKRSSNKTIIDVLEYKYGTSKTATEDSEETDEEKDDHSYINYNVITISTSGGGVSQTAWYTNVESKEDNQYRATMIYLAVPMSFNLGTMEYTLASVDSVIDPSVDNTQSA